MHKLEWKMAIKPENVHVQTDMTTRYFSDVFTEDL